LATLVHHLLLYDGVCGLCDRLVQFVLRHDRGDRFRFAALQSPLAGNLLRGYGRDAADLDTVYVIARHDEPAAKLLSKGRAVLFVLTELGGIWRLASVLRVLPRPLLDFGYDLIARRRYRWFGRYDACPLPTPATRAKFLAD
jgi:predicted DCC family thiol-disulfide oxidoreductase YuxK